MHRFKRKSTKINWKNLKYSLRMRDLIVFSMLPVFIVLCLLAVSILDYQTSQQYNDWWSRQNSLLKAFGKRIIGATNHPKAMALRLGLNPEESGIHIINLNVNREQWALWQRNPLSLWGTWIDADIVRGNELHPVKLRKRGDTSVHWTTEKKSFTLKTSKSSLFKGYRKLAFSCKTVLEQYLTNSLSSEFDLLSQFSTITPLFINNQFYGLFRIVETVDESFLRRHNRLPGNIYRGDTAERGEYFKGRPRDLFINPHIWDRVSFNNRPTAYKGNALEEFLRDLNGTTFSDHLRLLNWLDTKEIARLVALMFVTGDPYHMSGVHNQFWFEDPSSGLLHLLPMDLRLLDLKKGLGPERPVNRFLSEALKNPYIFDDVFSILYRKLENGRLLETSNKLVNDIYKQYEDYFKYDNLRKYFISEVGTPHKVLSGLRNNLRIINEWFGNDDIAFHAQTDQQKGIILDFETRGYVGNNLYAIELYGKPREFKSALLFADSNLNGLLDASDEKLPYKFEDTTFGGKLILETPQALLSGFASDKARINSTPINYRYFITNLGLDTNEPYKVRTDLRNRLTNKQPKIIGSKHGNVISRSTSWHPWRYPTLSVNEHHLTGNVHLHETLVIAKGETLVITPGTTIRMDSDVSILAYGKVKALGTQEKPIIFTPFVEGKPWGAIALQGEDTNGSTFEHVKFIGGGGALLGRVEYKGMVNAYWSKEVSFRNCNFTDNVRSDDAFSAANSSVELNNCKFVRANADAIDFDYSSGKIYNCRFEDSGNDGIDLMTSSPGIVGNTIVGSKDKGISIGERSHPFIFNNHIYDSFRGVEIRDQSEPFLVNNLITDNIVGLHQYSKNWRYNGGGWGKLIKSIVVNNKTNVLTKKDSQLAIIDSLVDSDSLQHSKEKANLSLSGDLAWIFLNYGINPAMNTIGIVDDWTSLEKIYPNVSEIFSDDFNKITDGWKVSKGVKRLVKRKQNLEITFQKKGGSISKPITWNLSNPDYVYLAVFEFNKQDLKLAEVELISEDGKTAYPLKTTGSPDSYTLITVQLEPAHYKMIKIKGTPEHNTGRIKLHKYSIYSIPKNVYSKLKLAKN